MPQAIVDPAEMRRFAHALKTFNGDLQNRMQVLHGQLGGAEPDLARPGKLEILRGVRADDGRHFAVHRGQQRAHSVPVAEGRADRRIHATTLI